MESLATLGSVVGTLLKDRKQTLAVAQSSAGGPINAARYSGVRSGRRRR